MDKVKVFEKELFQIQDDNIRLFTSKAIEILPDYFFTIPASSSGKYHPKQTICEGGLVIHTRMAFKILTTMFGLEMMCYEDKKKDIMKSALLLHDGAKNLIPNQDKTAHEHPVFICDYILKHKEVTDCIDSETLDEILGCIKSHMGQWSTSTYSKVVLPKPKTQMQKWVHLCDYLASRKFIEINLDE